MHPRLGAIVVIAVLVKPKLERETSIFLETGRKRRRGLVSIFYAMLR